MISFGIRNLKVFFKDRASVFFSLLAVFIIIGLYALFLGDVWVSGFSGMSGVRYIMDTWIMAGLLAVTSFTTTMGAFGIMVEDRTKKIVKDFAASPISKGSIVGGYIFGAVVIGIIMSLITLVLAEIYIVAGGGELMQVDVLLKVLGLIVLSTICNTSLILFMVSFFKSNNAFGTASTIVGTIIGFLTGIYLPIGNLPEGVQFIVKVFPVSHSAVLFRQAMMEQPMSETFAGAPPDVVAGFKEMMGVVFYNDGAAISPWISLAVVIITGVVFYGLSLIVISRKSK
jgi:multidrug/hemolysin transport system permease protein